MLTDSNASPNKRLLLINPNTTEVATERLMQTLVPILPKNVQLDAVTAQFGAAYIACEASHAVAGHAVLDRWVKYLRESVERPDGVLIGCFGDPGLFALRESSACQVTGLAEASFIEAAALGEFAIVTGGERWRAMLMRLAQSLGFGRQLKHIEIVAPTGAQLLADRSMALRVLSQACQAAAATGIKSIIMGGAGLASYAKELQAGCALPLIDSAEAGLRVLLGGNLPRPERSCAGFDAIWSNKMLQIK